MCIFAPILKLKLTIFYIIFAFRLSTIRNIPC